MTLKRIQTIEGDNFVADEITFRDHGVEIRDADGETAVVVPYENVKEIDYRGRRREVVEQKSQTLGSQ